jgi:hypothetical protein
LSLDRKKKKKQRKDQLKEAMYRKLHPHAKFVRVRWDDENKVGADVLAAEIVGSATAVARESSPFSLWIRDLTATIKTVLR